MDNWLTSPCHLLLAALLFLLANTSGSSPLFRGKRLPYITSDLNEILGKSFDYIIVGGGTTGCPLAATLSEKHSVLVVERGGSPYGNPLILDKKLYGPFLLQNDEFSSLVQSFVSEDGVENLRGRVLGGTSAINGGFYSRASGDFIRKVGWDKALVKEAYEWVESMIVYKPQVTKWQAVLKNAFLKAGLRPYNGFSWEHVEGTKIGGAIFDKFGIRHSSTDLLQAGNPGNITVLLNATVKSVIFHKHGNENKIITKGIKFISSNGSTVQIYKAYLNQQCGKIPVGDVILSAGALGSPQILMLSGIGPEKHLKNLGIPLVLDLKGVGQEMKDSPTININDTQAVYRQADTPQVVGIAKNFKYIVEGATIPLSSNLTTRFVAIKFVFPESKGKLELRSTDPRQNPSVRFNYLSKETDLNECADMVQVLRRVTSSIPTPMLPRSEMQDSLTSSTDERKGFCKKNVRTYYHYHGGCTMGSVVDNDYRVHGVKGLRVIDGSTFPESPGTNPMATCLMLGRYQGIRILRETKEY